MGEEGLSTKQVLVLNALLAGKLKREAAEMAGVTPRTVSRWMQLPVFRAALNREAAELSMVTSYLSARAVVKALEQLIALLEGDSKETLKVKAAIGVLQHHPAVWLGPIDAEVVKRRMRDEG